MDILCFCWAYVTLEVLITIMGWNSDSAERAVVRVTEDLGLISISLIIIQTIQKFRFMGSNKLFQPPIAPGTLLVLMHTDRQNTDTQEIIALDWNIRKGNKKNKNRRGKVIITSVCWFMILHAETCIPQKKMDYSWTVVFHSWF